MNKTKKIIFVLIATVAIVATLVINAFAERDVAYHKESYNYLPNVSTFDDITHNRTSLPNNTTISDGVIARAGDINNSVRIICGAYTNDIYSFNDGFLKYTMISAQPFEFTIDFGCIVNDLYAYKDFYPDLDWSGQQPYHLRCVAFMSVAENAFNDGTVIDSHILSYDNGDYDFATNGIAFDDFGNMLDFSEVPSSDVDLLGYDFAYSDDISYANNITGKFYQSFESYAHYYVAEIYISTFHDRENGLSYFINRHHDNLALTLADLNYSTPRLIRSSLGDDLFEAGYREGESVGYNNGYLTGKSDGLIQGRDEGYTEGYDEGYEYGADNAIEEKGMFSFFIESIGVLFKYPLFELPNGGNISLGLMLGVVLGASTLIWILKLFAGG